MERTVARVRVRCLVEEAAELVVVEAVVTVRDDLLRAEDNDLLAVEELLCDDAGEAALNVTLSVDDNGHLKKADQLSLFEHQYNRCHFFTFDAFIVSLCCARRACSELRAEGVHSAR